MPAETREAFTRFATACGAKYPKAVMTLEKDADALLTFLDFPAEHWNERHRVAVRDGPTAPVRDEGRRVT